MTSRQNHQKYSASAKKTNSNLYNFKFEHIVVKFSLHYFHNASQFVTVMYVVVLISFFKNRVNMVEWMDAF